MKITRDPQGAAEEEYDAIIVGGGIYGITLALEAGRRGLKTLILEKGDFGEQTSFNSLKIIHGGLRYLQSLDLHRFKESVGERTWFLRHFPERVRPLPCFMPLYGNGMRKPGIFRAALFANHVLSLKRNSQVRADRHLPMGKVVGVNESRDIFPLLDTTGLKGGAVWYDGFMPDSQLLIMDLLLAARGLGATALNYVCATEIETDAQGKVSAVSSIDRESGTVHRFRSNRVINAAGPWCRKIVEGFDGVPESLFRPSLAWNVLFDRTALSDHALAVQAREPGSRLFFITPWKDKIFAGTGHEPWLGTPERPCPDREQLLNFICSLNTAVPGLELRIEDVKRIFAGLLPTTVAGSNTLTKREVIVDHGAVGGPAGLFSVGGIKFTTARLVAEKILNLSVPVKPFRSLPNEKSRTYVQVEDVRNLKSYREILARDESIMHLDDLLFRRSMLFEDGEEVLQFAETLCTLFPWNEEKRKHEIDMCRQRLLALPDGI